MIDSKAVRSPAGQKLINDLMLGDGDMDVGTAYDDVADAEEPITPASKQRSPRHGALPLRPSNGSQRRGSLLATRSVIESGKTLRATGEDREYAAGAPSDRPATAPASSSTILAPPQLPAARGQKDSRTSTVSPLLERHLVSRHTSAYLGVVTAVLHQVSSPAATGAPRDTQRRPGTVPRDVYHHSAIAPPKRHVLNAATSASAPVSSDGIYGDGGDGATAAAVAASRIAAPGSPTGPLRVFTNGGFHFHESPDVAGSSALYAPFGVVGGQSTRGGTGECYVPYLDRSYGSHAPLACTVDAVARRAEAHKALTRQRLLQKQLVQQMASGRKPGPNQQNAQQQEQNYQNQASQLQTPQQPQKKAQIVLLQPGPNEPYQLRMEGGVLPVALGLAWDTSPGVVVAAAAAAATTAAAIAARAEGLSAAASPYLRDSAPSLSFRDVSLSPGNRTSPASLFSLSAAIAPSPGSPQRRRGRGGSTLEWAQPQAGLGGSGRASPTGAPGSPHRFKLPRTPQTAAEAAVLAAEAEEVVRAHLPPAVRRGYNGHLAAQTVKDWETIAEPNRRMMQEIENATTLVRGSTSRVASAAAAAAGGGGNIDSRGRQSHSTGLTALGSASMKRHVGGQEVGGPDAATAGGDATAARSGTATSTTDPVDDGTPFGKHTSARARRRYIRYSLDVFPELGLPQRINSGQPGSVAAAKSNGPFSTAGVAAATAAATAAPSALAASASGWGPWAMPPTDSSGLFGLDTEPSTEQMDPYNQTEGDYGTPYGAARGPRYVLAAAARVPVPIHLHPLPTPPAAIAAVVAGGGAAGAAAAALPQWVDPLAAATSGSVRGGAASSELDSPLSGLHPSVSTGSALVLPTVGSGSQNSLHSSRGVSRTTSVTLGGLSARGVGLQGCPSVPPLGSPSASMVLDEPSGSLSGGGGGSDTALTSRNVSVARRHGVHHSGKQLQASVGGASAGVPDQATLYREQSGHSSAGGLASTSAQRVDDSQSMAHAASSSVSTLGRSSAPSQEASLLPRMHGAAAASLRPENSLGPSEPQEGSSPAASTAVSAAHSPGLQSTGSMRGMDLDLDLDLGPTNNRASAIQRRGLLPGSSAAGSRLSIPESYLPASTEEREQEDAYDVAAAEREAAEAADAHGREEGGWSFRESGFTSAGMSSNVVAAGAAEAIAAAVGTKAGADEVDWDAGPTPRLVTRPDGSRGGVPSTAVSPLPFHRPSSTASGTVGSASVGSFTPRSGGGGTSNTHMTMEPAAGRMAVASPLYDATVAATVAARVLNTSNNAAAATDYEADVDATAAAQGFDELSDGDGAAGFASSAEDFSREDVTLQRAVSVTAAPQGPVLTHGTGYRVVTSVAASLVSEDPREAARLAVQRDLEAQLERSSEHTAKLKAASRASKALARAGPQHSALLPANLPPLSMSQTPGTTGYSIVQPRASRVGLTPLDESQGGALSVLDAPVPAPAEMEAMASAARAALSPALPATMTSRLGGHQQPQTSSIPGAPQPQRRLTHHLQSEKEGRQLQQNTAGSLGPGSYMHIQATIERGRTAHMQDLWAT